MEYDLLVFIGRFRPFHQGHKHVIEEALKRAKHVLVLVGSANRPRTIKNPWTKDEVFDMIRISFPYDIWPRLVIDWVDDHMHDNDFHWCMEVQQSVDYCCMQHFPSKDGLRIGLVGFSKDSSSYYLKKFPQWSSVNVPGYKADGKILNATDIRNSLLNKDPLWAKHVPPPVERWMNEWLNLNSEVVSNLIEARDFALAYKQSHKYIGGQKYEPIHTTTDSIFIQSSHVLLGKRKFNPGKDLWALPGGFAHVHEALSDTSKRESREETKIKLGNGVIDLAFRFKHVFSDVNRSDDRGRIITHAYLYLLNDRKALPEVEAADDFSEVKWVPLGLLEPKEMYSDHYWMIHKMINMIPVD